MAIDFKFRSGALVTALKKPATEARVQLPGDATAEREVYVAQAGTIAGVATLNVAAGDFAPAVLAYAPVRAVWDFARGNQSDRTKNATALMAIRTTYSIVVTSASDSEVKFVFAPGEQAPADIPTPQVQYAQSNPPAAGSPAAGVMGRLSITASATPWGLSMAAGELITDLVPKQGDGARNIGGASLRLLGIYGKGGDFSETLKVGGSVLSDNGARADGGRDIIVPPPPAATVSAARRTLALVNDIPAAEGRAEEGGRSLRDLATAGAATYPLVGGDNGDLIDIISFDAAGDVVLFARDFNHFSFLTDNAAARAFSAAPVAIGGRVERDSTNTTRFRTIDNPPAGVVVAASVAIGECEIINNGVGYLFRFSNPVSDINTPEKLRRHLLYARDGVLQRQNTAIAGVFAGNASLGKLAVYGDLVRRDVLQPLNQMNATADPVGDASDAGANATPALGFSVGSQWFNRTTKSRWICTALTNGGVDATWERVGVQYQQIFSSSGVSSGTHNLDYVNGNSGARWQFSDFGMLNFASWVNHAGGIFYTMQITAADWAGGGRFGVQEFPGDSGDDLQIQHVSDTSFRIINGSTANNLRTIYGVF